MSKPVKIGLVGFGRIGRNLFRLGYKNPNFQFTVISDFGEPEVLQYLLMRDSVHGVIEDNITVDGNFLVVDGQRIRVIQGGEPGSIPWDAFGVDVVIEATGKYREESELQKYLSAGAKRVFVTVPPENAVDRIIIHGINENTISINDKIISTSSSTTHVLALMLKMLDEKFGVKRAMMTTIHAYTSDQPLADAVRSDLRRSRSAVENIIPNTTWSPQLVEDIMPQFKGKLDGIAFNVPVSDGSCVDLTTELERMPSVEEVNAVVKAYTEGELKGIVGYTEDPIVSSDVIGSSETMTFDSKATMIACGKLLKTLCWYDNGWGYSKRILELLQAYNELEVAS